MAYITIQINCPSIQVGDLNAIVLDSSLPHDAMARLVNFLEGLNSGAGSGSAQVVVNTVTQTIVSGGGGNSATYNLL